MESADVIEWYGDSYERFIERAIERQAWGHYNGHENLGKRLVQEVQDKIKEIAGNLNLYQARVDEERVATLFSNEFVLIYLKRYFQDIKGNKKVMLVIIDVRKSY